MAQETINSIREAEARASKIVKDAKVQADAMLEQAYAEGKAYGDKLIEETKKSATESVNQVLEGRNEALDGARRRAMAVLAQHKEGMEARIPEAVDLVISEII